MKKILFLGITILFINIPNTKATSLYPSQQILINSYQSSSNLSTPVDSTTYYIPVTGTAMSTTANLRPITIVQTGKISSASVTTISLNVASAEYSIIGLSVNGTKYKIWNNVTFTSTATAFSTTTLDIAVNKGDKVEPYIETPAWATNPSNTNIFVNYGVTNDIPTVNYVGNIPNNDLFFGLLLFYITAWFIIGIFKRK